jgi:hypothetical protein
MKTITKSIAVTLIGLALSAPVFADGSSASVGFVGAGAEASQGNEQNFSTKSYGSDLGRGVPAVVAPALTTTLSETCMGSTSLGASGAGFGFSVGSTWRDEACIRRLDARELRSMGRGGDAETQAIFALASKERMCEDEQIRAAFERVATMTGNTAALCQATADEVNHVAISYVEPSNAERVATADPQNEDAEEDEGSNGR